MQELAPSAVTRARLAAIPAPVLVALVIVASVIVMVDRRREAGEGVAEMSEIAELG